MKRKKSTFLKSHGKMLTLATGLIVLILWILWGNITIQVSHHTIEGNNIPEEFDGFKIAHVSDLHNKNWGQALIKPLEEENPDLIVITGDLIDSIKTDVYTALDFVKQAKNIAPIYYVTGNQEAVNNQYVLLESGLLEHGVTILDNEATLIQNGADILLLGIQDPLFISDAIPLEEHESTIEHEIQELTNDSDGFKILLSHRPELFDLYVKNDIDLVLSGHAHGGQFRLPIIGGVFAPDQGFFPTYTAGLYQENNTRMIVSRGLGNSMIPIRFNNRPELIFIHLSD